MIGKHSTDIKLNLDEIRFIIVYEKFTKPVAISLSNQLSKKFNCVTWDKKQFLAVEPRISNRNKIIFLDEDLIKENFANPSLLGHEIVPGIDYKQEGNKIGLVFNETTSPKKLSDILKENWRKYIFSIIVPDPAEIAIIVWLLATSQRNKIKFKLYMDAVDTLVKYKLQEIFNG
ncbi:MAG: hypothetical protein K2N28_03035 [Muribaculaceae bacterium]|nr:hypothetical protein [Muribaculaceae bacterium]